MKKSTLKSLAAAALVLTVALISCKSKDGEAKSAAGQSAAVADSAAEAGTGTDAAGSVFGAVDGVIRAQVENGGELNSTISGFRVPADEAFAVQGTYANGGFTVTLPQTLDAKYLNIFGYEPWINVSDRNAAFFDFSYIMGYDSKGSHIATFILYDHSSVKMVKYEDYEELDGYEYSVSFRYADRDVTIEGGGDDGSCYKLILKKGWNKVYSESHAMTGNGCITTAPPAGSNVKWHFARPNGYGDSFTDSRDGQTYRTVVMGRNTWMAQNLKFKTNDSWCYGNDDSNCAKYGRLYTWDAAMKASCPAGWRVPAREDWNDLVQAAGGDAAGKNLKSKTGWDFCGNEQEGTRAHCDGNGIDKFGFSALPGGIRYDGGGDDFDSAGSHSLWWCNAAVAETDYGSDLAWVRRMGSDLDGVEEDDYSKGYGFYVRCVR